MRVLVTGSTGLVASTLVESLIAKGYEVRALARKTSNLNHLKTTRAEIVFGDITDYDTLPPAVQGIDIVFHAAARVIPGWGAWEEYEKINVKGTRNMLRASVEAGVGRFLQVSSVTAYGEACQKGDIPADESTPCEAHKTPSTYYDYSKLLAEQACWEYHRQGKLRVSMIRIGTEYGPRHRLLAERVYKQPSFPIIMWPGKANSRYAITYVSDIAELAMLAATNDKAMGQVYNVAGPEPVRLKEFTQAVVRARGAKRSWLTVPYPVAFVGCYLMGAFAKLRRCQKMPFLTFASLCSINNEGYLDGSKARQELKWEPKISLEEGTRLYVQWRRAQGKHGKGSQKDLKKQ